MEIKDPMYKPDDYVVNGQGATGFVVRVRDYNFDDNEYTYIVKLDDDFIGEEPFIIEFEYNLEPCQEPPKTVWNLKEGDTYYLIFGDGKVTETTWGCCDKKFREIGNTFLTREEAEFEVERRRIETKMLRLGGRRKFKKGEDNYYIFCDFNSQYDIRIYKEKDGSFGKGMIYFDSIKDASNAIDSIGEDRIKKYYFGVDA